MKEIEIIDQTKDAIRMIRDTPVILDSDVAQIFGVETKRLNQNVKRNIRKFPEDFRFQLTQEEFDNLKSQNAASSWGGRRSRPYVFTEHGVLQAANVIHSDLADSISVFVVRAFIELREVIQLQQQFPATTQQPKSTPDSSKKKTTNFLEGLRKELEATISESLVKGSDLGSLSDEGKEQEVIQEAIRFLEKVLTNNTGNIDPKETAEVIKMLADAEDTRQNARKKQAETKQLIFIQRLNELKIILEYQLVFKKDNFSPEERQKLNTFIPLLEKIINSK